MILALSLNNDAGLTLNDVGNEYTTINVTIGAQASSLTINDIALTTLTIFGPSGLLGPAGSLAITDQRRGADHDQRSRRHRRADRSRPPLPG